MTIKETAKETGEVRLEKVDYGNAWDIMKLRVTKEQDAFVARNAGSLVEAYLTLDAGRAVMPFGIYVGKKPVGFLMIGYDWQIDDAEGDELETPQVAKGNYMIWRLMIDKRYQGRGYGKEALRIALDYIRTFPCGKAEYCWLSYEPENETAKKLYASFGFVEASEKPRGWDEIIAMLKL